MFAVTFKEQRLIVVSLGRFNNVCTDTCGNIFHHTNKRILIESVLYEFGGIIVICDAGGCTGNICGFDEPRWFESKSALFSAGLRDMDAILGRDDRLVAKLADAVTKLDAKFAAIIGTPVPAVIGTDYHALKRMTEKKVDLSILTYTRVFGRLALTRQNVENN